MSSLLICVAVLSSPVLYRPPVQPSDAQLPEGPVWVYFTDKGMSTERAYRAAVQGFSDAAPALQRERRSRRAIVDFDYDDLPVRETYVRSVERLGGRLRAVSRWLNAASFELPSSQLSAVRNLPFVHDVRPVVGHIETDRPSFRQLLVGNRARTYIADSAEMHEFYGPSYEQAEMMGIPELFFKGYFGSGVRLAIFDTGLKRNNAALEKIRLYRQHDFLSGDNLNLAMETSGWSPLAVGNLRHLGLVADPEVVRDADGALLLCFVADSFLYEYNSPRRAILATWSEDDGATWTEPSVVEMTERATGYSTQDVEDLALVTHDSATYLAYSLCSTRLGNPAGSEVHLGRLAGRSWQRFTLSASGRNPDVAVCGDALHLVFANSDSVLVYHKYDLTTPLPTPVVVDSIVCDEPLADPAVATADRGLVTVLVSGVETGRIVQFRSTDGGASFFVNEDVVGAGAYNPVLRQHDRQLFLFFKDASEPPFIRLSLLFSPDMGREWVGRPPAIDRSLVVGGLDADCSTSPDLQLFFETGGMLHRISSADAGATWDEPTLVDTAGFCYLPKISDGNRRIVTWFRRGDTDVDWEEGDEAKFAREQPDHGTRMSSIIAGWLKGAIVGIAPGVDLMFARTELHRTAAGGDYEFRTEEDTYVQALEWAEHWGADIVSTSLGYRSGYRDEDMDGRTAPISVAAALAARRGLIVVTAMGNRDQDWPLERDSTPYIVAPADAEGVIAAGGVTKDLLPYQYTGTGPTADGRVKPELTALADEVAVAHPDSSNLLQLASGTSCATALTAGCCALILEAHPDWPADSVKYALFSTATHSTQSCTFGYGVPRVDSAFGLFPPAGSVAPIPEDNIYTFPNPFVADRHDTVYFALEVNRPSDIPVLRIYTAAGTLVRELDIDGTMMSRPGRYADPALLAEAGAFWDGKNASGQPAASGLYVAALQTTFGRAVCLFTIVR